MPDTDEALIAALTGATWRFVRADGSIIYERLVLLPGGILSGAHNPNEAAWRMKGGSLEFLDHAGDVTTRFVKYERDGTQLRSAAGPYLRDQTTGVIHVLHRTGEAPAAQPGKTLNETPGAGAAADSFETVARLVAAASLADPAVPLGAWSGPAASVMAAPEAAIEIRDLPGFTHGFSSGFASTVKRFFSASEYRSAPWTLTLMPSAVVAGTTGAILTERDGAWYCLAETLGHISWPAYNQERESYLLRKQEHATQVSVRFQKFLPPYDDDALNVVLSPVNNYGHWHVHNIALLFWLAFHAPALLDRLNARRLRLLCPFGLDHVGAGMKDAAVQRLAAVVPTELVDPARDAAPRRLRNVLVSSSLSLDYGVRWPALLPDLFADFRRSPNPSAPRLVYCNRGHAGQRGIVNEPELEAALVALGFTSVSPGEMDFHQQRDTFANARLIVGAHGAALTNLIYSHARPAIVELSHPAYGETQYWWFRHLAAAFGGSHGTAINPIPAEYAGKPYNETYFALDVPGFLAALHPALENIGA